jgi:hypothetical protein
MIWIDLKRSDFEGEHIVKKGRLKRKCFYGRGKRGEEVKVRRKHIFATEKKYNLNQTFKMTSSFN